MIEGWIFGTALVFTALGWKMGRDAVIPSVVSATIESLIEDGYLKTTGHGDEETLVLWRDWDKHI